MRDRRAEDLCERVEVLVAVLFEQRNDVIAEHLGEARRIAERVRTAAALPLGVAANAVSEHEDELAVTNATCTLAAVVDHYDANLPPPLGPLTLTATERAELVEFLKSL